MRWPQESGSWDPQESLAMIYRQAERVFRLRKYHEYEHAVGTGNCHPVGDAISETVEDACDEAGEVTNSDVDC